MFTNVELHKLYTVTIPDGITDVGINLLSSQFYTYIKQGTSDFKFEELYAKFAKWSFANPQEFLPDDWVWQYAVGGRGQYIGNMARRMSKLAWNEFNIVLAKEQLAVLGQLARDNSNTAETVYIDFTDKLDWNAGEFGDAGSCYWGGHNRAREILMDHAALGLRLWRSPEVYGKPRGYREDYPGIGRAWVIPPASHEIGNYTLIYNGYGGTTKPNGDHTNLSTLWFARILAAFLGTDYKKVKLLNNGNWDGEVYVNNGNAYAVGDWLTLADLTSVDLEWDASNNYDGNDDDDNAYTCEGCGWSSDDEDNFYYSQGDQGPYCEECYDERWTHCASCGSEISVREVYDAEDDAYCYDCYNELFFECYKCGNVESKEDAYLVDDENPYCERCIEHNDIQHCYECGGYYTEGMYAVIYHCAGDYTLEAFCEGCFDSKMEECQGENCKNYFDPDYADDTEIYCEHCRVKVDTELQLPLELEIA